MKKVLLTSTALVLATAGMAAADITLSGSAKMGIAGGTADATFANLGGDLTTTDVEADGDGGVIVNSNDPIDIANGDDISLDLPAQFYQDVDVTFTMTGETDGGLAFGVSVDLDEAGNLGNEFDDQGVAVFISGDFGRVTLGDTDGALDFVIPESGFGSGSMNDAETSHFGYAGSFLDGSGDGQIARYDYTFDAFQFALSVEQGASGANGVVREDDDDLTWAIGFSYQFEFAGGTVDTGIGYQYSDNGSIELTFGGEDDSNFDIVVGSGEVAAWAVGALLALDNGFSAGVTYTNYDFDGAEDTINHWMIGADYTWDAWTVGFNYGTWRDGGDELATGYGLTAGYDLGGGAELLFGYGYGSADILTGGSLDFDGDGAATTFDIEDVTISSYSLGLVFSF